MVELDVGSLPLVSIPAPLKAIDRPAQLSSTDAAGLVLTGASTGAASSNRKGASESTARKIETTLALPTSISLSGPNTATSVPVNCLPKGTAVPLRWETFSVRPDGGAIWAIHDGWFDPNACRVSEQRQTVVQPRALALLQDQPVAFAVRTAEGLVVIYPTVDNVLGEAMTGPVKLTRAIISRATIPLAQGSSSTVISTHNLPRMAAWLAAAEGKSPSSLSMGNGTLTLRVEVTQTVSEDSPTLLLQLRSNRPR